MLKMKLALIFGLFLVLCLSYQVVQAEDADAKGEPVPEGEPAAEPTGDEATKQSGKSVAQDAKTGKSTGVLGSSALAVPTILALVTVAKWIL